MPLEKVFSSNDPVQKVIAASARRCVKIITQWKRIKQDSF